MISGHSKLSLTVSFLFLLLVSSAFFALSYNKASAISESSISADLTPEDYGPNQNIDISLSSFSANLDTVLISWFVNGKASLSGIGKKSFSITSGAAGSQITVLVKISLPDGEIDKTISIRPNIMTLLWQANDSFVPPFYRGKAMPSLQSEIKVVAMPEIKVGGVAVDAAKLTYSWQQDYNNNVEGSGYGKNSFVYTGDYLDNSNNVSVTASTIDLSSSSTANVSITASSPEIEFYKKDSALGVLWERTMEDGSIIKDGDIIVAIPYFISPKNIMSPELSFNWFINDAAVALQGFRKNVVPLKVQAGTSGTSKLRLEIGDNYKIFQNVNKEIQLSF